jgi:chromosome partitioning protein
MAIRATVDLLQKAQEEKPNLKAAIVLNMIKSSTTLTEDIRDALRVYKFPLLQSMVTDRVSYTRSPITGGVFETDDEKAQDEILNLAKEIIAYLNQCMRHILLVIWVILVSIYQAQFQLGRILLLKV